MSSERGRMPLPQGTASAVRVPHSCGFCKGAGFASRRARRNAKTSFPPGIWGLETCDRGGKRLRTFAGCSLFEGTPSVVLARVRIVLILRALWDILVRTSVQRVRKAQKRWRLDVAGEVRKGWKRKGQGRDHGSRDGGLRQTRRSITQYVPHVE